MLPGAAGFYNFNLSHKHKEMVVKNYFRNLRLKVYTKQEIYYFYLPHYFFSKIFYF